jgi:hypothetical protein
MITLDAAPIGTMGIGQPTGFAALFAIQDAKGEAS